MLKLLLIFGVTVGSWNLKWFPSGRAEHRASESAEQSTVSAAAEAIRANFRGNGRILFLQELRDFASCSNLVAAIGDTNLHIAVVTEFRDFRDNRRMWQQLAIVTDLPILSAEWKCGGRKAGKFIPRGYAYAMLDGGTEGKIGCYCIHLKSNYGATTEEIRLANTAKRTAGLEQVLVAASAVQADRMIIAGDFNADRFSEAFQNERIFKMLKDRGFADCWKGVPVTRRGTHPGGKRYPDSTLDYIFFRGYRRNGYPRMSILLPISDHRLVIADLLAELPEM